MTVTPIIPAQMKEGAEAARYSPAVVLDHLGLVLVSGQVGRDSSGDVIHDPEKQYVAAFENLQTVLAEAGAGLADIVDLTTYHVSFGDFALFRSVKDRYLVGPIFPAWTGVGVPHLALPGLLVEMQATAVLPRPAT